MGGGGVDGEGGEGGEEEDEETSLSRRCSLDSSWAWMDGWVRIRSECPVSSKVVVCGHCLVTLSLTVNETLKWLSSLLILMQESF